MSEKHTPGPWKTIDGAEIYPETGPAAFVELCRVIGPWDKSSWYDAETATANAHLIASAPDLLTALEMVLDRYTLHQADEDTCRSAIAAAKGGSE